MTTAYTPLLNWAVATGRIDPADRMAWVTSIAGAQDAPDHVVGRLLAAAADPNLGDVPPPLPWGSGDPSPFRSDVKAASSHVRASGRRIVASFNGPARPPVQMALEATNPTVAHTVVFPDGDAYEVPAPTTPAPTLFPAGDLPSFTASGIDPQVLLQVPWQARPALARAQTRAEAYALLERYSGEHAETMADLDAAGDGPLADDAIAYTRRYREWAGTPTGTATEDRWVTGEPGDDLGGGDTGSEL